MSARFLHFALIGIVVTGFLSIPWQVYERREDIKAYIKESPYFTAPGNRSPCDMWIAHQSDSSKAKWIIKCTGGKRV